MPQLIGQGEVGVWWQQGEEASNVPGRTHIASHLLPLISLYYVPGAGLGTQQQSQAPKDLESSERHGERAISHNVRQIDNSPI